MPNVKTSQMPQSSAMAALGRLGRFAGFFLTAGYAFPDVFVEGLDLARIQGAVQGDLGAKK